MFSFEKLIEANNDLKKDSYTKFEFPSLIEFLQNSLFYFIDEKVNDLQEFRNQFKHITNIIPLILFDFIKDKGGMDLYLVIYTNKIGLIYDLILGPDILTEIFRDFFQHFVLMPTKAEYKEKLSFFIDLSNNYFLNSDIISELYENGRFVEKCKIDVIYFYTKNKSLVFYYKMIISLIVCYVPLISVVTDNFQLNPANLKSGKKLPEFNSNDFILIERNYEFSLSLVLYKKTFEFYFSNHDYESSFHENYLTEKIFLELIYNNYIDENSFIIPCYGTFKYSKLLLFKFACKRIIGFDKLDDTTKTSIIYRFLGALTTLHECGYYIRTLTLNYIIMDNDNRSYFTNFWGICPLDNRDNNNYGAPDFISHHQFFYDVSSPLSDVYSYAKICKCVLNYNERKKINLLFDECIIGDENKIPDSLILFIQMYKKKLFLPNTNQFFIDKIFNQFFNFFLNCGIDGGKYMKVWSNAISKNKFKNLIFNSLPLSFIVVYSYTEFEINLNIFLNDNEFPKYMNYEIENIFKINFFAKILNNHILKKKTDEIIDQIPTEIQVLNKFALYENLKEKSNSSEIFLLNELIDKEKRYLAYNFDKCIKQAHLYSIKPSKILSFLKEKQFQYGDSHSLIEYLIKVRKTLDISIDQCFDFLSSFDFISFNDVCELNSMYNTQKFYDLQIKIINKPIEIMAQENKNYIEEQTIKLNDMLDKITSIENKFDQNDENNQNLNDNHEYLFEIIRNIEKLQTNIKLLSDNFLTVK